MKQSLQKNAASIRARLLTIAKESKRDFNAVLLQYFQERFLYRLSVSAYSGNFVLKGALLFLAFEVSRLRPTKDIDLLGVSMINDPKKLASIFREISQIAAEDGVEFLHESIRTEVIKEYQKYEGLRIKLAALLTSAQKILQIDIAFGDPIVPKAQTLRFPVLLNQAVPVLQAYSGESVIAEKLEAIVSLNFLTSRMKDFYDLHFLARHFSFELQTLASAIQITFHHRGTPISDRSIVFAEKFIQNKAKQSQWLAFLNRNDMNEADFSEVMNKIQLFIEPACADINRTSSNLIWEPREWRWK